MARLSTGRRELVVLRRGSRDDPLFEPLPPVEIDPDHEPPPEHVALLRQLVTAGLHNAARMLATGRLDEAALGAAHGPL